MIEIEIINVIFSRLFARTSNEITIRDTSKEIFVGDYARHVLTVCL